MKLSIGYSGFYNKPKYLNQINVNNFVSLHYDSFGSNGASSNFNFRDSILGSIGEAYERQGLINFVNQKYIDKLIYLDVLNNKISKLEINKENYIYFCDTCGLATHTSTYLAIESSLSEFVERQSFIFSYLSKKPKLKLIFKGSKKYIIPKDFKHINFYEISLIDSYKVVLGIGKNCYNQIDIGLGAGYNLSEAIKKVIKEISPVNRIRNDNVSENSSKDYMDVFNKIDPEQILNAYNYLDTGKECHIDDVDEGIKFNRISVFRELHDKYDMNPFIFGFFSKNNIFFRNKHAKIIKIIDFKWFPSLKVAQYPNHIYDSVEGITGVKLNRKINFIPFP